MDWIERAEERLSNDFDKGIITEKEYHQGMRDLRAEAQEYAREAAERAYDDSLGNY